MGFPIYRPRRTRATENLRSMIRETELSVNDLIYPLLSFPAKTLNTKSNPCPATITGRSTACRKCWPKLPN